MIHFEPREAQRVAVFYSVLLSVSVPLWFKRFKMSHYLNIVIL
jgi:hypothetical protein